MAGSNTNQTVQDPWDITDEEVQDPWDAPPVFGGALSALTLPSVEVAKQAVQMIEGSPADEDSEPPPTEGPDQAVGPSTSSHVDDMQEDVDMAIAATAELTPWVTSQGGPQFNIENRLVVVPWSMLPDQTAQQPTSVGDQRSSVGVGLMDVDENYVLVSPWTLLPSRR